MYSPTFAGNWTILSRKSVMGVRAGMQAVKGRRRRYMEATVPDSHLDRGGKTA